MAFVSLSFILFVAVTVLVYFAVPPKFQWCVLLAAGCLFFWLNSEWLILVLFGTVLITYVTARLVYGILNQGRQHQKEYAQSMSVQERKEYKGKIKKKARCVLTVGITMDLGILFTLKYFNFFAGNVNRLLKWAGVLIPEMHFLLPLGISFYTLQAIGYMVDVYRGKTSPDQHFGKFMLFMSYFPQIVQGPIARHDQLAHQLYEEHRPDPERIMFGAQLMLWGFMKKLIIADRAAILVDEVFAHYNQYYGWMIFVAAAMYGLQVYTDFSGGMDIAGGVSQMLGIELEFNFRQPYFSRSIEEFWRRWHITLGRWMRDYVFYPLSLSKAFVSLGRKSRKILGSFAGKRLPSFLAMFVVYFLVGFWHGANWKYIAYGVYNGAFIMSGILLFEVYDKAKSICHIDKESFAWRAFQILRTFCLVSFGRLFSRADGFLAAVKMFYRMTKRVYDLAFLVDGSLIQPGLDTANWFLLVFAVAVLFAVDYLHERGVRLREGIARQNILFRWLIYYAAILILVIFGIYGPAYDSASFIYEQF